MRSLVRKDGEMSPRNVCTYSGQILRKHPYKENTGSYSRTEKAVENGIVLYAQAVLETTLVGEVPVSYTSSFPATVR